MAFVGKNVVVTGSTGRLGSVVVRYFLDSDANVFAVYKNEKKFSHVFKDVLKRKNLIGIKADLIDEKKVQKVFGFVRKYGGVDFLINCVGGYLDGKMIFETEEDDFDEMINLNLRTAFLCSKWALRDMIPKRGGRIINISALLSVKPTLGRGAYIISKASLNSLTEIIAEEVKDFGVTCNAILPSVIATVGSNKAVSDVEHIRWVEPVEIAKLIGYLCSDEAKGINGALIKVPGGV